MPVIQEYEFDNSITENQEQVREELERLNPKWEQNLGLREAPFEFRGEPPNLQVKVRNVCGQIEVSNQILEIIPKYLVEIEEDPTADWRSSFLRILAYSETERFELTSVAQLPGSADKPSLIDLMARAYVDHLSEALVQGPPTEYENQTELRTSARGRLYTRRLYPQVMQNPSKLWFKTTELSSATDLGRILRWACNRLASIVQTPSLRNNLLELEIQFKEASIERPSDVELNRYSLSPQHRRFEQPLLIARWLAEQLEVGFAGEDVSLPGILFKSSTVFEDFVDSAFREISADRGWDYDSSSRTLAKGPRDRTISPDHVITGLGGVTAYDSKYVDIVSPDSDSVKNEFFYQVMAYGRILEADRVGLVYPQITESISEPWTIVTSGNPTEITVVSADPVAFIRDKERFLNQLEATLADSL